MSPKFQSGEILGYPKGEAQGPLSNNPTDHSVGFFPKLDERSRIIAQTFLRVRKDLTFFLSEKFLFGSLESLLDLENSRTLLDRLHWVSSSMQYAALEAFRELAFGFLRSASSEEKAMNSWSAVQDTYHSTKDTFERHRVVFTIGTSIASVATAWAGYSIRYLHQEKVDKRLAAIEDSMKNNYQLEHTELKKIYNSGNSRNAACIATAGVTLIIGYGLGWRGGRWYANRKFRREQMKLLGQIKPKRTPLQFLRRLRRQRAPETAPKTSPTLQKDAPSKNDSLQTSQQQLL